MNKRKPTTAPVPTVEPSPRRPQRSLLVISGLVLAAWVFFLLLVALQAV